MASKEICCLRGFVTTITSTADYGTNSGSDVIITTGSTSRFFLNGACPDFCLYFNGSNRQGEEVVHECSVVDGKMIFDTGADL